MRTSAAHHRLWLFMVSALFLIAWGGVGLYEGLHRGFTGGLYDPEYVVPGVMPGGAAERAGFRVGDRVLSVDGIPVESLGMESRWPRSLASDVGQSRRFLVKRGGETIAITYVYPAPSRAAVNNRIGAMIVGTGFLAFGLWAFAVGTAPAVLAGYIGLAAGVAMAFSQGPSLGWWNGILGHISIAANVLMFILLLRFFVIFPKSKRLSERRAATWAIYVPWVGLLVFLVAEVILHPALYYTTGSIAFPLMLVYGIMIFAAIVHTLAKASWVELVSSGMAISFVGLLIAIFGTLARFEGLLPVPGWVYSPAIVAVPLSMALAVRKQARSAMNAQRATS